jgi:hypothetical protein
MPTTSHHANKVKINCLQFNGDVTNKYFVSVTGNLWDKNHVTVIQNLKRYKNTILIGCFLGNIQENEILQARMCAITFQAAWPRAGF